MVDPVATVAAAPSRQAAFWDRIAERYAAAPVADEATYERKLAIIRDELRPGMEVLEFGCGTGSTAIALAPLVGRLLAIDTSARMIGIAGEKADRAGVANLSLMQADLEALAGREGQFDVVLGMNVLHLLDDRDAAIDRVCRLLKPGGAFISSTACLGGWSWLPVRLALPVMRLLGKAPPVRWFTRAALRRSLEGAGFAVERDWKPGPRKAVFMVARKT